MNRIFAIFLIFLLSALCFSVSAEKPSKLYLSLYLLDRSTNMPVSGARVRVTDTRDVMLCDSLPFRITKSKDGFSERAFYSKRIDYRDTVIIDITANGYAPATRVTAIVNPYVNGDVAMWHIEDIGLEQRMTRNLDEVTVTATRVKMVMRGDTLVYDATAFNLPTGSMLDDLIRQLPGATLDDDGRITVNGEFVSELLVNGRSFFKGDPQVALRNLPHYTVKELQVYRRNENPDVAADASRDPLVMDVRLKKEYAGGWLSNYELGGGSSLGHADFRWLGRLFALHFRKYSYFAVYVNANNLNNSAKAGRKGDWSKSDPRAGESKIIRAGMEFNTEWTDSKREGVNIKLEALRDISRNGQLTLGEDYLPGGNTYTRMNRDYRSRATSLDFSGEISRRFSIVRPVLRLNATHEHRRDISATSTAVTDSTGWSAPAMTDGLTYLREQLTDGLRDRTGLSAKLLLYYSPARPDGPIFRSMHLVPEIAWHRTSSTADSYDGITHPAYPADDSYRLRRFDTPARDHLAKIDFDTRTVSFGIGRKWKLAGSFKYVYNNSYNRDTRMIDYLTLDSALSTLLPSAHPGQWLPDDINSHLTSSRRQRHDFIIGVHPERGFTKFNIEYRPCIESASLTDRRTAAVNTVSRHEVMHNLFVGIDRWDFSIPTRMGVNFTIDHSLPELLYMLDVTDSADPMLVRLGNPDLKKSTTYTLSGHYIYQGRSNGRMMRFTLTATRRDNLTAMARYYDRLTGVVTLRPQNVSGNHDIRANIHFSSPLGRKKRLYLSNTLTPGFEHSADYSSATDIPERVATDGWHIDNRLLLRYTFPAGMAVSAKADMAWTHLRSRNGIFTPFHYTDYNIGAGIKLPLWRGGNLDTDIMAYSRTGYGDPSMDGTDWVWNLQLSQTFGAAKQWTAKATGFDLLRQLPTIKRVVNPLGSTETRYNSQPAYAILTLTYRLDIKPRRL